MTDFSGKESTQSLESRLAEAVCTAHFFVCLVRKENPDFHTDFSKRLDRYLGKLADEAEIAKLYTQDFEAGTLPEA